MYISVMGFWTSEKYQNLGTADAICSLTLYATAGYTLLHHSAIQ